MKIVTMFLAVVAGLALVSSVSCQTVGFTATIVADTTVAANQVVVFPVVVSNCGNGYESTNGIFTCPTSGVYLFKLSIMSAGGKSGTVHLYKNDVLTVSATSYSVYYYESASNSVTLLLSKGDRVYIKTIGGITLYGRSDEKYSTFTGVLIGKLSGEYDREDNAPRTDNRYSDLKDVISVFIPFKN